MRAWGRFASATGNEEVSKNEEEKKKKEDKAKQMRGGGSNWGENKRERENRGKKKNVGRKKERKSRPVSPSCGISCGVSLFGLHENIRHEAKTAQKACIGTVLQFLALKGHFQSNGQVIKRSSLLFSPSEGS